MDAIVRQTGAGIAQSDLDGRFLMANPRYCEITGYGEDELRRMRMQDITHPEDLARNLVLFRGLREDGRGFTVEKRYLRKDGTPVWVSNQVTPIRDRDGTISSVVAVTLDISESKAREQALQESEQRFRQLADQAPMISLVTEADGACSFASQSWFEYTGQAQAAALGNGWTARLHPDDRDNVLAVLRGAIESAGPYEVLYRLRRRDGAFRWSMGAGAPRLAPDGCFLGHVGSIVDIHDRKQAADDARFLLDVTERVRIATDVDLLMAEVTRLLAGYLRASRCYFAEIHDPEDRWVVVHDHPAGEGSLAGTHRLSAFPTEVLDELRAGRVAVASDTRTDPRSSADYEAAYAPIGVVSHVIVPLLRGGQWQSTIVVADDAPREWQPREVALLETVAERVWNARERLRLSATISRQRRLYEGILDNTLDLAYLFDLEHRFIYANRVLLEMWGKTWDEARGKTCLELGYEPWHAQMHDREIEQVVATRQPVRGVVPFSGTFGRRIYDYIFVPVFGADGEVEAVAGTTRDITELKAHEEALREADRRKDEFLATLAHELRNPLAPLRNSLQILQMDRGNQVDQRHLHGVMERQVGQLVRLVDDLLEVSRITQGKIGLRLERTTLGRVVDHAVETSRPLFDAAAHRLDVEVEDPLLVLEADPTRLAQVVSNLLNNAARYTPPGGHVVLSARREGTEAVVSVRDNGAGIPAADLPRVFDLFVQSREAQAHPNGGLGIGLTLVRTLVELHGGRVQAHSDGPGEGSEFTVRLPLPEVATA